MGIFDMFKANHPVEDKDKDPYVSLTMDQGENDNPTIDDVFEALNLLKDGQTDFVSLAHLNKELEIEVIQAIGSMDTFALETLPSEDSQDKGKIFYKDYLDQYSLEYYFQDFFERETVSGLENFEER